MGMKIEINRKQKHNKKIMDGLINIREICTAQFIIASNGRENRHW